jgi:K+-sensing histidine kinase KdpD
MQVSSLTGSLETAADSDATLGNAIAHGIRTPLAALRASIEALVPQLKAEGNACAVLNRALMEIVQVDHCAEALMEFAHPTPLRPMACTPRELAQGALASLQPGLRRRIWLALESDSEPITIDGPVAMRALAALLESAARRPAAEVLLHSHQEHSATVFAIVDDLAQCDLGHLEGLWSPTRTAEDVELALASRDIRRLGGELAVHETSPTHCCVMVRLPNEPVVQSQEEAT